MTIKEEIRALKYRQLKWALEQTDGNIRAAARMLGCNNTSFARWMREVNLTKYAQTLRRKRDWWLAVNCIQAAVVAVFFLYALPIAG